MPADAAGIGLVSDGLAFLFGALTIYFDCYSTLTERIGRAPESFIANPAVLGLSALCGAAASICCWLSSVYPHSVLVTAISLDAPAPWRGIVVGASVLVLIRSRLFNVQGSAFGGDYLYQLGREAAIQNVNNRWSITRQQFQTLNIAAALRDPQFEANALALIAADIRARPDSEKARVALSLEAIKGNRPKLPFDPANPDWVTYTRALIGVVADECGLKVARTLDGFR